MLVTYDQYDRVSENIGVTRLAMCTLPHLQSREGNEGNHTAYRVAKAELVSSIFICLETEPILSLAVDVINLCGVRIENGDINVEMGAAAGDHECSVDVGTLVNVLKEAFLLAWS